MSEKWKLDDIDWSLFKSEKVDPDIIRVLKAGSVVEHNGFDYGIYLKNVFKGDDIFSKEIDFWSRDEIKHGLVLAKWVQLADPSYNFEERFQAFLDGYSIAVNSKESIRGSRSAELLTRCMVEIATSSFYSALKDATDEPLLKQICGKIAADELRHYKLFYTHLQRYKKIENLSFFKRFKIAAGRLFEEDDELAFAYYAANNETDPYDCKHYTYMYGKSLYKFYEKIHVDRAMALFCKALGLNPTGWLQRGFSHVAYRILTSKAAKYERELNRV